MGEVRGCNQQDMVPTIKLIGRGRKGQGTQTTVVASLMQISLGFSIVKFNVMVSPEYLVHQINLIFIC